MNYTLRVSIPNAYEAETISVQAHNPVEAKEKIHFLIKAAREHPEQDEQITVVPDA